MLGAYLNGVKTSEPDKVPGEIQNYDLALQGLINLGYAILRYKIMY